MRSPYGRRLREARRNAGLSRERVAIAVDKSYSTVASYESGQAYPSLTVALALAELYGVAVADLFGEVTADVA